MGRKKVKKFIDKKNAITFQLVGRSQNDPLFVDETAPQYVLVEKKTRQEVAIDSGEPSNGGQQKSLDDRRKRREEQIKYGIYFDDDYDYLQHLTDVTEISFDIDCDKLKQQQDQKNKPSLMLPSSVFESNVKENEDLSKKAALPVGPQLDWDPDIVEAMQDDFDFDNPDNQIDDDFVQQAMGLGDDNDHESDEDNLSVCGFDGSDDQSEDDDDHDVMNNQFNVERLMNKKNIKQFFNLPDDHDMDGKTVKTSASTHFTEYSMSSSVLPRNNKLQTLDEQFEQMFIREYADQMEMGALDAEEINGQIDPNNSDMMSKLVEEYQAFKSSAGLHYERNEQAIDYVRTKILDKNESDEEESEQEEIVLMDCGRKGDNDRLDCESILSVYSNTNYHPQILSNTIDRYGNASNHIRISKRTGMPTTAKMVSLDTKSMKSNVSRLSELSVRPKQETPEQRRQRKKELKEYRAERRAEKKANRMAFKEEQMRMHKADMNKSVQKKMSVN